MDMRKLTVASLLSQLGLERRSSRMGAAMPMVGMFGLGALVGATAALLLSPSSGKELRGKIGRAVTTALPRTPQRNGQTVDSSAT